MGSTHSLPRAPERMLGLLKHLRKRLLQEMRRLKPVRLQQLTRLHLMSGQG